jgi:hypothetical protein
MVLDFCRRYLQFAFLEMVVHRYNICCAMNRGVGYIGGMLSECMMVVGAGVYARNDI